MQTLLFIEQTKEFIREFSFVSFMQNILASIVFLFLILWLLRPQIKICGGIAKTTSSFVGDGKQVFYLFKFINKSFFSAYDVLIELHQVESYAVDHGMNYKFTSIKVECPTVSAVSPFRPAWLGKSYAKHAIIFHTLVDLQGVLKDEMKSLEVHISLKHGVSGLPKIYKVKYSDLSCVKEGRFAFGNNFEIKALPLSS